MITCRKQRIATKNSTESELVGMSDTMDEVEWAQDFIMALGYKMQEPRLYQDNQSAMTIMLEKPERRLRIKHLTARHAVLYETIVTSKEAILSYKYTKWMLVDPFTKPLEGARFQLLMNVVMGWMSVARLQKLTPPKITGVRCNIRENSAKVVRA